MLCSPNLNVLFYIQVTATGYSNIAQALQLTSLVIGHRACDSMCMHALAQLSTLVILQLQAGWATAAVEHDELTKYYGRGWEGQRCKPPSS